jgi:O-antigen/teichoic acid export membrane protein
MSILKKNIIANYAGKSFSSFISIVFIPIYIKFIGIEAYGLIGIYTSLLIIFTHLDFGLGTIINKELSQMSVQPGKKREMRNLLRSIEIIYWPLAMTAGIIVVLLSSPISFHWIKTINLDPDLVRKTVIIMGIGIAFQLPFSLYSGVLLGLERQVSLNLVIMSISLFRSFGTIFVFWWIEPSIELFFICQTTASAVQTVITGLMAWRSLPQRYLPSRFSMDSLSGIWNFTKGVTGITFLSAILLPMDKIILSKILNLQVLGYYVVASSFAGCLYTLGFPIFSALFPRFSQLVAQKNGIELKRIYHQSCQLMSVMILPIVSIIALFSREILILWFRDPILADNVSFTLSLLAISVAMDCLMLLPYALQLANSWTRLTFYSNLICVFIAPSLIITMASQFGIVGAAFSWLILRLGYVLITIPFMHQRLLSLEKWRWYFEDIGKPLLAALLCAGLGRLLISQEMNQIMILSSLAIVVMLTMLFSCFATPFTRKWVFFQIRRLKRN